MRESEGRFREMADNAPVMVWMTEPDATCSFLSKSWYDFTGQTRESGLGFGWLDAALWGFFLWSVISSLVSYEPLMSLDKLRGAAIFLIFYFVLHNIRTARAAVFLAVLVIASCMVNVLWMPVERLIGRGVAGREGCGLPSTRETPAAGNSARAAD